MNPSNGTFQAQPEASDMQQRMRVGVDTLSKDLVMAGAGAYIGSSAGALTNYFAPIMPYRTGSLNPDPPGSFSNEKISLIYVPPTPSQTTVNKAEGGGNSQEIDVDAQKNCGPNIHTQLCGFENGMRVLIFDNDGSWDAVTITNVQNEALHLQHTSKLSGPYNSGAAVLTQVATHTYYLKTDTATSTYQLMHYDGYQTDLPVLDNVVKLNFEYFGDPQPPQLIPGKSMTDTVGPWTTYGPKPPPLGSDNANDTWAAGENCTFQVTNGVQVPRLASLAAGVAQVKLDPAIFSNGDPMCPDNSVDKSSRFDADLLRIRRVRVVLRVQAASVALRGPAGTLFLRGGQANSANRFLPDQEIRFDVTPRNMNLGR
jgi:hypothetical protein